MKLRINTMRSSYTQKTLYFLERERSFLGFRWWGYVQGSMDESSELALRLAMRMRRPLPEPTELP